MKVLFYSRISTGNPSQITSLSNQKKTLQTYQQQNCPRANHTFLEEILSISNGMSSKLRYLIKYEKYDVIVVSNVDRLIRSYNDVDFIKNNVKSIICLNGNKEIKLPKQHRYLSEAIAVSTDEIDTIKSRIKYNSKSTKSDKNSREYLLKGYQKSLTKMNAFDKLIKETCRNHNDLTTFMYTSQNIGDSNAWQVLNKILCKYGYTTLLTDYKQYVMQKAYPTIINLSAIDLFGYAKKICMGEISDSLLLKISNSYFICSKKYKLLCDSSFKFTNVDFSTEYVDQTNIDMKDLSSSIDECNNELTESNLQQRNDQVHQQMQPQMSIFAQTAQMPPAQINQFNKTDDNRSVMSDVSRFSNAFSVGHPPMVYQPMGYPQMGYPQMGYSQMGNPQMGYSQMGYPQMGYQPMGYPQMGYPQMQPIQPPQPSQSQSNAAYHSDHDLDKTDVPVKKHRWNP